MSDSSANAYLRTRVLTASPEQLRLMLLDGAIRFLRQGRDGLAARNYEQSFDGFTKGRAIILELTNSMRHEVAPDLCARLHGLYMFIYQLTIEASLEKDLAKADRAISMLEFERETWDLAIQQLQAERATSAQEAAAPARTALSIHA